MEVVYFFCEPAVVRIPFLHCVWHLFYRLLAKGGEWDKAGHQFVFRQNTSVEELSGLFANVICVRVEMNSPVPIRISGFMERPWEEAEDNDQVKPDEAIFTMAGSLPLPEKFPEHWRIKLEEALCSRKYSPRTLHSYIYYNCLLCRTLQKPPGEIHTEDVKHFLAFLERDKEYSASSLNLAISAIKFFYREVFGNEDISEQTRPRHDKRLPVVLSKAEISKILGMEKNPKHRLLLMLVYSSGLRVSEVVALKREHIDLSRKIIHIRLGKGRKDRCTILSEKAAGFISEYCAFYGIQTWLFPGQTVNHPLTIRSAQHIFDKAIQHAEIHKKLSIHSLRHTFATHLLESGTDIRYIQTLLGHTNLRTTERYTHIARRSVLRIQSPLDTMED